MRFFNSLAVGAISLATSADASSSIASRQAECPELPIPGPFYLTIVPAAPNGNWSDSWPTNIAVVSRGVKILSSALSYHQQYTFDAPSGRLFDASEPSVGNLAMTGAGSLVIFDFVDVAEGKLEQVTATTSDGGCAAYLVLQGAAEDDWLSGWKSAPSTGLPVEIEWNGPNTWLGLKPAALRIDVDAEA